MQSMKEEWEEKYKKTFRERKVKDILSALLFAMVYGVLLVGALSPAQNIINDIASGIGMGMATVVVAFVGLVEVKNRLTKGRNKKRRRRSREIRYRVEGARQQGVFSRNYFKCTSQDWMLMRYK